MFLFIKIFGPLFGILPFLALAWLGFAIWSPGKFKLAGGASTSDKVVDPVLSEEHIDEDK